MKKVANSHDVEHRPEIAWGRPQITTARDRIMAALRSPVPSHIPAHNRQSLSDILGISPGNVAPTLRKMIEDGEVICGEWIGPTGKAMFVYKVAGEDE